VPTGLRSTFSGVPAAIIWSAYSAERTDAKSMPRLAIIGASGLVRVNLTVWSSTFSIDFKRSGMPMPLKYS
jgi:hypothetical protein